MSNSPNPRTDHQHLTQPFCHPRKHTEGMPAEVADIFHRKLLGICVCKRVFYRSADRKEAWCRARCTAPGMRLCVCVHVYVYMIARKPGAGYPAQCLACACACVRARVCVHVYMIVWHPPGMRLCVCMCVRARVCVHVYRIVWHPPGMRLLCVYVFMCMCI